MPYDVFKLADAYAGLADSVVGSFISGLMAPVNSIAMANVAGDVYSWQVGSYFRNPQVPPSPQIVLDLYNRGYIDEDLAKMEMRNNGVNWRGIQPENGPRLINHYRCWEQVGLAMKARPGVEMIMNAWGRGFFDPESDLAKRLIKRAGGDEDSWSQWVDFYYAPLPITVASAAMLRGKISREQFYQTLDRSSYGHDWQQSAIVSLLDTNPPASDWIYFAVKEALSPDVANQIQLYDEFPESISRYLGWHGLNWEIGMQINADGVAKNATIADLYWASHWTPIAPGQAYEMFHRYRPGRLQRYQAAGVNVSHFGIDDVKRWLRINDYPVGVRENLAGLSFTQLRLVDIRNAVAYNYRLTTDDAFRSLLPQDMQQRFSQYNRQWAIEQFRDRGVLPDDANTQVDLAIAAEVWRQQSPIRSAARSAVKAHINANLSAYRVGIISYDELMQSLQADGVPNGIARAMEAQIGAKVAEETAKSLLATMKRAYHKGLFTEDDARDALIQGGLRPAIVDAYIQRWNRDMSFDHRQAETTKIVQWVASGYMSPDSARVRLSNLGWRDPDTTLLMAEASAKNLKLQATAIKAADSARQKRTRELTRALEQARKNVATLEAAIRRQTPVSTLQRWLRKTIINERQFMARMIRQGYSEDVARGYLADAFVKDVPTVQREQPGTRRSELTTPPQQQPETQSQPEQPHESEQPQPIPPTSGTAVTRPETQVTRPDTSLT